MKFFKSLGILLLSILIVTSCQKEYSEEGGGTAVAVGTLKKGVTGECLPSRANGIFIAGTTLVSSNYLDVTLNFTTTGTYLISSDTLNGYNFKAVGIISATGLATVRLIGIGKPLAAGSNTFTIKYGANTCNTVIDVIAAGTAAAVFTPGGTPGTCTTATLTGVYKAGAALNSSNTVTLAVNVTTAGTYNISIPAVNGVAFSGSGALVGTGIQTITLGGTGTPTAAGNFLSTFTSAAAICKFNVTTLAAGGGTGTAAVYTLGGANSTCTGVVLNGTFRAGLAMGATNTAKFNVTVTTVGTYTIATTAVNGVTFSGSGSFAATGAQTVTLTASGTPAAAGPFNYPSTGAGSTCSFSITYTAAGAAAVFTLGGAPTACTPATVAGTYTATTILTASNTVTIQANVTTAGTYTIASNAVNGMTFSATGVFAGTGPQTIVLVGAGTPAAAGTNSFSVGTSSCTFSIIVTGAAVNFITCKIGGTPTTFNVNASFVLDNSGGFPVLSIDGESTTNPNPSITLGIVKTTGTITAATYTVNQLASGIAIGGYYFDAAATEFLAETDATIQNPAFTITITSITATRVIGTFSGTLKDNSGVGPGSRIISEGVFNVGL